MASVFEFHKKCGSGIVLTNRQRHAARTSPQTEFDNALVFSKNVLPAQTLFEVEIAKKMSLWSGSLAVGVTECDPNSLEVVPASISHLRNGTWVLAGNSVLKNGLSCCDDYEGNLEELIVGDRVGVMLHENGELHYFINGQDMGCAAKNVPEKVFVVIDVYGRCSEVKLYSGDLVDAGAAAESLDQDLSSTDDTVLRFHPHCGSHVKLTNNRKTVLRTNPNGDFNFGIALTARPLAENEVLEIEIEEVINKWAGSLEIGVTTHVPGTFSLPGTMTNITSGTWMFSGGAIVHNGITVLEAYGRNTVSYKVGDRLGVGVQSDKSLHFYYNGVDLGPAASDLSSPLYGVVDVYGQAVQASILDSASSTETLQLPNTVASSRDTPQPVAGGVDNQLTSENMAKFCETHGRLIALNDDRTSASRLNALAEFNHAVVVSQLPLEDDHVFEVVVEKITDRWSGSLEVGVLSLAPPDLQLPITLTDLNHHCWIVSGSSVMQDGNTIINGYGVDLDSLGVGSRVGVMRKSDSTFHVFVNGEDRGIAASFVPPGVFATFDLYGQCVQISIATEASTNFPRTPSVESLIDESMVDLKYSFHNCSGEHIAFRNHGHTAVRTRSFNKGLVFSDKPLDNEAVFEIRIDMMDAMWTGSLSIGVTSHVPPTQAAAHIGELRNNTVYVSGSSVFKDGVKVRSCSLTLDKLQEGSRVGLHRHYDGSLHAFVDSKYKGVVATDIPQDAFGVVDVYGSTQSVSIVNTTNRILLDNYVSSDEESSAHQTQKTESEIPDLSFHMKCGLNIIMDASCTTARRKARFNDGLVFSRKPLSDKEVFQVRVDSLNASWSGSLAVGVLSIHSLDKLNLPATAVSLRYNSCVLVHGSQIYINGNKVDSRYPYNFDELREGDRIGVICDGQNRLHIIVNDVDQGFIEHEVSSSSTKYAILDLYGRCEQLSIAPCNKLPELLSADQRTKESIEDVGEEKVSTDERKDKILSCENCEYRKSCERFKASLGIPEQYFMKNVICYCLGCCEARGVHRVKLSGDPAQEYARPIGWCKFELRLPPNLNAAQIFSQYLLAYHAVHVGSIRRTLDRGTVLPPRKSTHVISAQADKKVIVSPSIVRATALTNEKIFLFTDTTSGKRSSTRVAFEIRVPSDGYTKSTNSETELDSRDWCLELPAKIVLSGLLVQICEVNR